MQQPPRQLTGTEVRKKLEPATVLALTDRRPGDTPDMPKEVNAELKDPERLKAYRASFDDELKFFHLSARGRLSPRQVVVEYPDGKLKLTHRGKMIALVTDGVEYTAVTRDTKLFDFLVEQVKAPPKPPR
jgi:hypothetical protein